MTARLTAIAIALALAAGCTNKAPARKTAPGDPLASAPPQTLFARGVELRAAGDFIRAEQYLAAARDRGFDAASVIHELVGVCIDASRFQAALRYAVPYLSRHPEDWALRYLVGSLYLAVGEATRARAELERVTVEHPDAPAPHYQLARAYSERLDRPKEASAAFRTYLELAPDGEHAAEARAWLQRRENAP